MILALMVVPVGAPASELAVRESPKTYGHSCAVDGAVIGVDYLRRSLPTPRGMQHIPGALIFEVGVFPRPGRRLTLPAGAFDLEWSGLDRPETPAEPQLVVAQLLHEEWARGSHYPHVEASAGTIDRHGRSGGVIFGRPRRAPHPDELPERIIPLHALETTAIGNPSAGFVYFLYRGKLKKLKKLILRLQVGQATCVLKIRG